MRKKTREKLIGYGIVIGAILWLIGYLIENPAILSYLFVCLFILACLYIIFQLVAKRVEKEHLEKIKSSGFSHDRTHYIFMKDDYRRGNPIENYYRKKYFMTVLEHYHNKCAKCSSNQAVCLDHFVFSKNEGGNFVLNSVEGYFINNAIPLCQSCNSKKSDLSYLDFFSVQDLVHLFKINEKLTIILNNDDQLIKLRSLSQKKRTQK